MILAPLALLGCASGPTEGEGAARAAPADHARDEALPPFTDVVYGNNYGKHVHLQSFHGKTYIALSAADDDEPYVWSVDHETGQWQGPVQVGVNQLSLDDMHGNPSLVVDNEGYIHVWYGSHGPRHTSEQVYARSKHPEDISDWIHPAFDTDITYPMASAMSDGTICVLYRAGGHGMPGSAAWEMRKSHDNGLTWSEPRVIVQG